jgi:hypothetical protein
MPAVVAASVAVIPTPVAVIPTPVAMIPTPVAVIPIPARNVATIPFVTSPVAATVPILVAVPADQDRRPAVDGRSIHGCRLVDDGRRRGRVDRCGRDIYRSGNADVDPEVYTIRHRGTGGAYAKRQNTDEKGDNAYGFHGLTLLTRSDDAGRNITHRITRHISTL